MRLLLIRHAESEHAKQQMIADSGSCCGLTERGHVQAQQLAARFTATGEVDDATVVLTSPVLRARQTTHGLSQSFPTLPIVEDERLCELRPGSADGLRWQEYQQRYGQFDLVAEPERLFAPGGESWILFLARVHAYLDWLTATYTDQKVVAVTHAGFIVATLLTSFAIPRPGTSARFEPLHTSITEWHTSPHYRTLERYNDTFHLRRR